MHVLILPSWYPRGLDDLSGSFFREQAEALSQAGMQIGVLAPTEITPWEQPRDFAKLIFKPQQTAQFENGLPVLRFEAPHPFPKALRANTLAAAPAIKAAFRNYVRRWGTPDLIHAHSLFPGAFYAQLLSKSYGIPFVYTEHRSLNHLGNSPRDLKIQRHITLAAKARWGVSPGHSAHLAQRIMLPPNSFDAVSNLLPQRFAKPRTDQSPVKRSYTIGHLSNLDPVKEVPLLIRAFEQASESGLNANLRIAGTGAKLSEIHTLAQNSKFHDRIEILGKLEREQVAGFLSEIDLFVLPSRSESFGMVLIEAAAQGTPLLASRTWGGCSVVDAVGGTLISIGDQNELAEALGTAAQHPVNAENRATLRQKTIDAFGAESFVKATIAQYQKSILEGSR